MTITFAEYASSVQERKNTELRILKYTHALCEALRQNYIKFSIQTHENSIKNGRDVERHTIEIAQLKAGISPYDFYPETGRKYHKIIMVNRGIKSAHVFVDKKTGSVYKSASWKSPTKGERFNLLNEQQREWLYANASWCGKYLYRN